MSKPKFDPSKPFTAVKPKFDPNKPYEVLDKAEGSMVEDASNMLRSGVEGLTLGASEPVISGMNAITGALYTAAKESSSPEEFLSKVTELNRLKKQYDFDVENRRKYESENPGKSMAAETTGAIAPMLFSGGTSVIAKAPQAIDSVGAGVRELARQIPGVEALIQSPKVAGSVARTVESGMAGGVQALTQDAVKKAAQQSTGFIQPQDETPGMVETALSGAKFGAGMQAAPEVLSQGARALSATGKAAAKVFAGVQPETIDYYMANPERVKNAKSVGEIKDEIDSAMTKLRDDVENAKISKEDAKEVLKDAQSNLKSLIDTNGKIIGSQKADIRQHLRESVKDLNLAFKEKMSEIKTARLPVSADDVLDSVENVKEQVSDLSTESYKLLDAHDGSFNLKGVGGDISKIQDEMKVGNQLLSKDSQDAFKTLQTWKEKLGAIAGGTALPGRDVKRIIQELDSDIRTSGDKLAGSYSDKTYNALMQVRRALDSKIKTEVAGYAEIMESTAELNQLRARFSKMFGTREAATSKLQKINAPGAALDRQALGELGKITGKDFESPLAEYMATKGLASTSIAQENLKRSLPEYKEHMKAMAIAARANRPGYGQELFDKARTVSDEAISLRNAQKGIETADESLLAAKSNLAPFKGITEHNSESKIRTLLGDRSRKIELKKLMTSLGNVSDQDFATMIEDLRVKDTFDSPAMNGSRNVNLWSIMGAAFGYATGGIQMSLMSAGSGAGLGAIMDKFGPRATRMVLDGIVSMKGIPTIQKINSTMADLPEPLKQQLRTSLIETVTIGNNSSGIVIPNDQKYDVAQDIQDSKNLSNIEKAKAITEMNTGGSVNTQTMQRVMVGQEKAPIDNSAPPVEKIDRLKNVTDFIKNRKQEAAQ